MYDYPIPDARQREQALARHLGCLPSDLSQEDAESMPHTFTHGDEEYLVLTDKEADEECREEIDRTLWAFNASFWTRYVGKQGAGLNDKAIAALGKMQGELCEDADDIVRGLVGSRLDEMLDDAANEDGRGHFLSHYDGEEIELPMPKDVKLQSLYAYRVN